MPQKESERGMMFDGGLIGALTKVQAKTGGGGLRHEGPIEETEE
jgi:hypothetical protein